MNPYNLWDIVPTALMSLNHTNDRYPMSNQFPQASTHQPRTDSDPVFSSLRTMDSKGRSCASVLHSFKQNNLPDVPMNKTAAMVEKLSELWKHEQGKDFQHL